ncbi:MAG: hypothetical protein PHS14_20345, partial [Elusimicrobia bacterium]|nr:hypothetical protein [Elusimicrobiota bacterium]
AGTTSGDVKATFESMDAELAMKSLMSFLEFASPQEFEAFLGAAALQPRPPDQAPTVGPDGVMIPAPPRPSIVEAMQSIDLVGCKMISRFSSSTRAENFMRIKSITDTLAAVNLIRDGAGMPYADLATLIEKLLTEQDMEFVKYQQTEAEVALKLQALMAGRDPSQPAGVPKPDETGRTAGGGRGGGASPGRNTRGKGMGGPPEHAEAGASGNMHRMATSANQ